jgi:LuxR family maltose regulon positive regulatory protein
LRYNRDAMSLRDLVIQSQLIPPRQRRGVLHRSRLKSRLAAIVDYPLIVVHAGTGYGKSTTLSALTDMVDLLCWYTITEPDRDPLLFLAHLVCAFERQAPSWCEPVLRPLEKSGGQVAPEALTPLLNNLTSELDSEAVLVLDDYHLVAEVSEIAALVERLVDYIPPRLHIVISSRQVPPLAALNRWRVKGDLLTIGQADLAFTADEIELLFREQYGHPISPQQARALATETEGWAIALQMVWQSLESGAVPNLDGILGQLPSTLEALFDYLAQDVLARLSPEMQHFLLTTSILRQMDGPACDYLLATQGSSATLRQLCEGGLFVVSMGEEVYRYHRLFHDFLLAQLDQDASQGPILHRQAADYHHQAGHPEETVYHLLEAQDFTQAARLIEEIGPDLVALGRLDSLSAWIARLPEEAVRSRPGMDLLMGDVRRLRARFDEALEHYAAAERHFAGQGDQVGRSQALRGQAQVYLDTVRPLKADSLLGEALRLLEPEEHRHETAAILDKLAENKLNLGHPDEAQALHHEAQLLRDEIDPGDVYLEARALVRTGDLANAQELLERRAEQERQADPSRPQRFHRETLLLLSLVHALAGDKEAAERCAREGIAIGQRLGSDFVEAVGAMRLGHAAQLHELRPWDGKEGRRSSIQQAIDHYNRAIEQVRAFKVMRTQVEPLWGLCRAHGYSGDLAAAERYADQAMEIVQRSGDEWMQNLVQVTLGASYALARQSERARTWLSEADESFGRVGDPFGQSAARLWLALDAWWQGNAKDAIDYLSGLLVVVRERGYGFLLTKRTFIGLEDDQAAVPLLIVARRQGIEPQLVEHLLAGIGLTDVDYHPGYTLAVRTLGPFSVWRGDEPIPNREWKREKARQVFQLLLTYRGQWFYREQIMDQLWPHLPPDAAERDFKVALNALNQAIEPRRPRGENPHFVIRKGTVYGLNPAARFVLDVDDFERLATADDVDLLQRALSLYEDDYLPESLYEDWSSAERQRLRHLYLVTAERLARHLVQAEAWDEVIQTCRAMLARDNCWEAAYRLLMRAHAAQGSRSQIHSVYQRCITTLREELDAEPSATTQALFEQLF